MKQHVAAIGSAPKSFLEDLRDELGLKSLEESARVVIDVATDHRFVRETNDDGEEITRDLLAEAGQKIILGRAVAKLDRKKAKLVEELVKLGQIEAASAIDAEYTAELVGAEADDSDDDGEETEAGE